MIPNDYIWSITPAGAELLVGQLQAAMQAALNYNGHPVYFPNEEIGGPLGAGVLSSMPPGTFARAAEAFSTAIDASFTNQPESRRKPASGPVDDGIRNGLPMRRTGNVAHINLAGPMVKDAGFMRFFGIASSVHLQQAVVAADGDDEIDSILMTVDSPGGSVSGLAELGDAIAATRKPFIVQGTGMIASAAYSVASQADQIFVQRMDTVGSIGVRTILYDFSKMFDEAGVKAIPVDTGEHKSTGVRGAPITDEQIAEIQRMVDGYMNEFVNQVVRGRGIDEATVRNEIGDGRMFFAQEAASMNLVDGVRSVSETMEALKPRRPLAAARRAMAEQDLAESR